VAAAVAAGAYVLNERKEEKPVEAPPKKKGFSFGKA
jgi:hypothetical protein